MSGSLRSSLGSWRQCHLPILAAVSCLKHESSIVQLTTSCQTSLLDHEDSMCLQILAIHFPQLVTTWRRRVDSQLPGTVCGEHLSNRRFQSGGLSALVRCLLLGSSLLPLFSLPCSGRLPACFEGSSYGYASCEYGMSVCAAVLSPSWARDTVLAPPWTLPRATDVGAIV